MTYPICTYHRKLHRQLSTAKVLVLKSWKMAARAWHPSRHLGARTHTCLLIVSWGEYIVSQNAKMRLAVQPSKFYLLHQAQYENHRGPDGGTRRVP